NEGAVGPPLTRQSPRASCPDHSRGKGQPVIVVDASALVEVLLNRPSGEKVTHRLLDPREELHAPHLIDLEVAQALRRYQAAGEMSPQRAQQALLAFVQMPLERHPHWPFLGRIWELRRNLTAYDGAYVALA